MRTHIGEIEKARKDSSRTDFGFLKDVGNRGSLFDVAELACSHLSRELEQTKESKTKTKGFDLIAIGNCFICDPDWCPDYKKKLCRKPATGMQVNRVH